MAHVDTTTAPLRTKGVVAVALISLLFSLVSLGTILYLRALPTFSGHYEPLTTWGFLRQYFPALALAIGSILLILLRKEAVFLYAVQLANAGVGELRMIGKCSGDSPPLCGPAVIGSTTVLLFALVLVLYSARLWARGTLR
jgi:hypothetical protein